MKIIKRHTRTRIQIHTYTKKRGRKKKKKRKKIRAILQYTLKRLIFVLLTLSPFRFRSRFSNCPRFLPRKFQEKEKKRYFLHHDHDSTIFFQSLSHVYSFLLYVYHREILFKRWGRKGKKEREKIKKGKRRERKLTKEDEKLNLVDCSQGSSNC